MNKPTANDESKQGFGAITLDRREFLALITALPVKVMAGTLEDRASAPATESLKDPWLTFAAVLEHMLPSDSDSPGAGDIHALAYLRNTLAAPDLEKKDRDFLVQGTVWLNDLAKQRTGRGFVQLDSRRKESILRSIEQSRAGNRWLSRMLSYLLEALLSDPVYGGNYRRLGWDWLEHQHGFPTPTKDKLYYKLGKPVYRSTKA